MTLNLRLRVSDLPMLSSAVSCLNLVAMVTSAVATGEEFDDRSTLTDWQTVHVQDRSVFPDVANEVGSLFCLLYLLWLSNLVYVALLLVFPVAPLAIFDHFIEEMLFYQPCGLGLAMGIAKASDKGSLGRLVGLH